MLLSVLRIPLLKNKLFSLFCKPFSIFDVYIIVVSEKIKHIEFELVERAQTGDSTAFEELVKMHDRRVFDLAFSMLGNMADAQDVYQESFLRAWKSISTFRFKSSFLTWLLKITFNQALTMRKKRNLHSFLSLNTNSSDSNETQHLQIADASNTAQQIHSKETLQQINSAMQKLTTKERAVFSLKHFQDIKIREISEMLGYADGTVKNLLFRATRKMQKSLSPYIKDE